ncbi:MAG: septum formation initiator family protein [Proteobacteria bacterium]|nr:septum formation initiator family protein [Pseudomonadota bacterium]
MLWLLGLLLILLAGLQYRLWFAQGSLAEQHRLELQLREQTEINRKLRERNAIVEREVLELQGGTEGIEQRAREQLGLIREGETFYMVVDKETLESKQDAQTD